MKKGTGSAGGDRSARCAAVSAGLQAFTDLFALRAWTTAAAALGALARIAHPTSRPLFVERSVARRALRIAAIEGLARSGATDQLPAIARTLGEREKPGRAACGAIRVGAAVGRPGGRAGWRACSLRRSHDRALQYLLTSPSRIGIIRAAPRRSAGGHSRRSAHGTRARPAIRGRLHSGADAAGHRSRGRAGRAPRRLMRLNATRRCRDAAARVLRSSDARRRPRSARQGAGPRPPRRPHQRRHRRSRGVHRRIRSGLPRGARPTRATRRSTARRAIAYVYLNYGIHCLVNVVTEAAGLAGGGADPRAGSARRAST